MEYVGIDVHEKQRCISRYLKNQKKFKGRQTLGIILCCVGIVILCYFTMLFASRGESANSGAAIPNTVVGFLVGFVFGVIPFLIGQSIIIKAKQRYGRPFTERNNEFLKVEDISFCYGYHPADSSSVEEMIAYQIRYRDIRGLHFDKETKILTVLGCGTITIYDDLMMTNKNEELSGKTLYEDSDYRIMLATEKATQIVRFINEKTQGGT